MLAIIIKIRSNRIFYQIPFFYLEKLLNFGIINVISTSLLKKFSRYGKKNLPSKRYTSGDCHPCNGRHVIQ